MLEQSFLETLPGDPEEAFSLIELQLRSRIPKHKEFQDYDEQRVFDFERAEYQKQYVITLGAFAGVHDLEIGVDFDHLMQLTEYDFINSFRAASVKIQLFASMCAFKLNARKRAGSTCVYVLTDASKARIRKQISKIKEEIDKAEITDSKRNALFDKLNNFASEVDKDRTRLESLTSAYIAVKGEAKSLSKVVEPVEKIFDLVSSGGKELWKSLPQVKVTARLEAPQEKLEDKRDFDLDDEIPF